jgi:PAS domain S-box-containing protein
MPLKTTPMRQNTLLQENETLLARVEYLENTLRAIQSDEVDAVVVYTPQGERIFTLESAEYQYRILIENMHEGALVMAHDHTIMYCNQCFAEMLGVPLNQVVSTSIHFWVTPDDQQALRTLLQQGETMKCRGEISLRKQDGSLVSTLFSIDALPGTTEHPVFSILATDLTAQKYQERILAAEHTLFESEAGFRLIADKANLAKSEFLSSMSHELRTPLHAVLGFAQLMAAATPPPTAKQKKSLDYILQSGWHLLNLINQVLDLAVIEAGGVKISQEVLPLAAVLQYCQAMLESQAQQRGIQMTFPLDCPFYVHADTIRLKQVMVNLLTNAIKYNRVDGTVTVQCVMSGADRVRISIQDTGQGLTQEQVAQLFEPFNRLGQENSGIEGSGIGLVVSKQLVELMGGTIGVESNIGFGSLFWFELAASNAPELVTKSLVTENPMTESQVTESQVTENNLKIGADEPHQVAASALPLQRTLLYVEDNPTNLLLIEELIKGRSYLKLFTAVDGYLGIHMAQTYQPDVIMLDINLPGISGFDVLKLLREDPETAHIPVIAMSANAMPRDIEEGMEAGFLRYLTKPIKIDEFMDALDVALLYAADNGLASNEASSHPPRA